MSEQDIAFEKWWDGSNLDKRGFATSKGIARSAWHEALQAEARPVAWRYRWTPKDNPVGGWRYVDREDECNLGEDYEREPLYAHPSPSQSTVNVSNEGVGPKIAPSASPTKHVPLYVIESLITDRHFENFVAVADIRRVLNDYADKPHAATQPDPIVARADLDCKLPGASASVEITEGGMKSLREALGRGEAAEAAPVLCQYPVCDCNTQGMLGAICPKVKP